MSERLIFTHEQEQSHEQEASSQSRQNLERLRQRAEQEAEPTQAEVEKSRLEALEQAQSSQETVIDAPEAKRRTHTDQKALKQASFEKSMSEIQSQLPGFQRTFSKVIHQKHVERISDIGAQTVARPSGILGGGIVAAMGSFILLYFAKHYGYNYSYSAILFLYAAGFAIGITVEFLLKRFSKRD